MAGKGLYAWGGLLCWTICALLPPSLAATEQPSGEGIIRESLSRHESYGTLCEELTMVLTDSRGERSVREVKTFAREASAEGSHFLLRVDAPSELSGVALLLHRPPAGETAIDLYLPAFGQELKGETLGGGGPFLDTDFTPLDLLGERPEESRYLPPTEARIDLIDYWVIEAVPLSEEIARKTGYGRRRIFVRQDTLLISRIDYLDRHDRLIKRQTRHDLKRIEGRSWQAGMVLMESLAAPHQTLLKRGRRVFADDCAPLERFTPAALFTHPQRAEGQEAERGSEETPAEESAESGE